MMYSEDELGDAAREVDEKALYFKELDWDNAAGHWGQNVTPWREHCPNCWDELIKVVMQAFSNLTLLTENTGALRLCKNAGPRQ